MAMTIYRRHQKCNDCAYEISSLCVRILWAVDNGDDDDDDDNNSNDTVNNQINITFIHKYDQYTGNAS